MNVEPTFLLPVLVLSAATAGYVFSERRARQMLESWAATQGYRIHSAKTSLWGGPFWFERGRNRWVFAIEAALPEGTTRHGHALCGSFVWGLWAEEVKVAWT